MIASWPAGLALLTLATSGVFGLAIGSFLNVVVYRVPIHLSVVSPPSACPRCGTHIAPRDNIPVLSWLLLAGKCRTCRTSISARYPLVEAGTALSFVAVTWRMLSGTSGAGIASDVLVLTGFLYLVAMSIALALIDIDVHRLPNSLVLPSYVVGAGLLGSAAALSGDWVAMLRAGVGMAALWLAYFILSLVYPGGMGFGDVKLAGVLGLFLGHLGWGELAVGAFAAFLLGGIYAVGLLAAGRATRTSGIPFGPWMLVGAWVGIFFGAWLWNGYLAVLGAI